MKSTKTEIFDNLTNLKALPYVITTPKNEYFSYIL